MDKKYIVDIKGKKFITYTGLLAEAHKKGLQKLTVKELTVDWANGSAHCIVEAVFKDITVEGVGSGSQVNCSSMVKDHFVEMSQTRAKARALRDALNIDMVAVDELKDIKTEKSKPGSFGEEVKVPNKCSKCNADVTYPVKKYSIDKFKKVLCMPCQKEEEKKE